ncbi:TonB-dependent receptor [Compostibacter hankyongensis]|uniref:TonB-dependent receptor n=1 Tax=Compostibacter hankyongensis TaxID=1007089 RepID=A0ABP8FJF7_9BACT
MKYYLLKCRALLCLPLWFTLQAQAQQLQISGKVTDQTTGAALPGVSVSVKGGTTGTVTDATGNFRLPASGTKDSLVFTYIGYTAKTVALNGRTTLSVALSGNQKALNEVVVVGYGTQQRKDVTGSISSVDSRSIREVPVTNAQQALQGRTAGVDVVTSTRRPGSEPQVRIRGNRSFSAGNGPLYIVDGIPFSGSINDINPANIASMDVLKDASATAIYGSRGANGVILITTKRGKEGRPVVSYDGYYGVVRPLGYIDVMNGPEFAGMRREANRPPNGSYDDKNPEASDGKIFSKSELENIKNGVSTDWQRLLLSPGYQTSHELGVSGGTEKTKYAIAGSYFRDQGIQQVQNYERYNLQVNIDQQLGKRVQVGISSLSTLSYRNGEGYNGLGNAMRSNPLGKPYDDEGKLILYPVDDNQMPNPLADYVDGARIERRRRMRAFNSLYGEVTILDGLKYRLNFGSDIYQDNLGNFRGKETTDLLIGGGDATAYQSNEYQYAYTVENLLTYKKIFAQKHNLDVTGLYSIQRQHNEQSRTDVKGISVEDQGYFNFGDASQVTGKSSRLEQWTILSFMGRVNYGFDDRYLATFTLRADGSSRFAPGHQWGYFPSVALGWNLSRENFLKDSRVVDNLKLRASYGQTGNTGIEPYQTQGALYRVGYLLGNNGVVGYRPDLIRNPDLTWETTASINAGLDFGFFDERISGSLDVYRQKTTDLLMERQLPYTSGFKSVLENVGATQNQGIELGISSDNIRNDHDGFSWSTDLNVTLNREKILKLYGGEEDDIGNGWFIGRPLNVFYDYEKIGIWQEDEKDEAAKYSQNPGEIRVKDQNNDGKIDDEDRVILGSRQPDWTAGMTNRFSYKGIDLSIVMFARVGDMISSDYYTSLTTLFGRYNNLNVDYWTPDNPTNAFPRPNQNQESPLYNSTLKYFDGSFFKIRNITLGYNFPEEMVQRWKMQSLRAYLSVQQPLILAPYRQKYHGIDPEGIDSGNKGTLPIDVPATYMVNFGVNVRF